MPGKYDIVCEWCGKHSIKRKPSQQFCNRWCRGLAGRRRLDNPFRYTDKSGYVRLQYWCDDEARYKMLFEHRKVWQDAHGEIPRSHVIHHKNEVKDDNRLDNLELMHRREHAQHHCCDTDKYPDGRSAAAYTREWRKRKRAMA